MARRGVALEAMKKSALQERFVKGISSLREETDLGLTGPVEDARSLMKSFVSIGFSFWARPCRSLK